MVAEMAISVNLTGQTIEQVIAKMRSSHESLLGMLVDDAVVAGVPPRATHHIHARFCKSASNHLRRRRRRRRARTVSSGDRGGARNARNAHRMHGTPTPGICGRCVRGSLGEARVDVAARGFIRTPLANECEWPLGESPLANECEWPLGASRVDVAARVVAHVDHEAWPHAHARCAVA